MRVWIALAFLMMACSSTSSSSDGFVLDETSSEIEADLQPSDLSDMVGETSQEDVPVELDQGELDTVNGDGEIEEDLSDTNGDVSWQPPFELAVCGMDPHEWLEPGQMGEVVMVEELLLSNLDPETVDGLLEQFDMAGIPPAKYGVRNFRFRYTTQDRGVPMEATGTIGIPWGEDVPWPAPVALWLHGTTGFSDDCAPSRDSIMGAAPGAIWGAQGYVVVAPDYLGQLGMGEPSPAGSIHPYLVGEATAIASLDSVRAAVKLLEGDSDIEGSADPQRVVVMGGSQGGHAALFTERYQHYYAPEFHIAGVVDATGPADLLGEGSEAMSQLVGGTGSFLFALVAMKNRYGHPEDLFGLFTNEEPLFIASEVEGYMANGCSTPIDTSSIENLSDIFLPEVIENAATGNWEAIPPWGCFLASNSIPGTPVPKVGDTPILTVYSGEDELLNNTTEKANWPRMCEEGYTLQYLECAGKGHAAGALASLPYSMKWLEARLNGEPLDPEVICEIQEPVDCSTL